MNRTQLELETRLESGLYSLGYTLGRRVYHEEVVAGKEVDDALTGKASEAMIKAFQERDVKKFLEETTKLTRAQIRGVFHQYFERDCANSSRYMFERELETDYFQLSYTVYSSLTLDHYEAEAERIVREGLVDLELIVLKNKWTELQQHILLGGGRPATAYIGDPDIREDNKGNLVVRIQEKTLSADPEENAYQVFAYIIEQIKSIERGYS